jgi:hypothetical protein
LHQNKRGEGCGAGEDREADAGLGAERLRVILYDTRKGEGEWRDRGSGPCIKTRGEKVVAPATTVKPTRAERLRVVLRSNKRALASHQSIKGVAESENN